MDNSSDDKERLTKLEEQVQGNRWIITLLAACIIALAPPILVITTLSMVDISQEVSTDQGKFSIHSRPLPESILLKIISGIGAVTIGGLALAGKYDVIQSILLGFKKEK